MNKASIIVYVPMPAPERLSEKDTPTAGLTTTDRWEAVRDSLWQAGFTDIRPAPPASLNFVPRALRRG